MKKRQISLLNVCGVILTLVYPFAVFCVLQKQLSFRFVALLLLIIGVANFLRSGGMYIFLVSGVGFSSFLYFMDDALFFKFYPVLMNFLFAFGFFYSLLGGREPVVAKIAKRMGYRMEGDALRYARGATLAWCIFLFLNTLASLITVFMSDVVWVVYNGFISYVLIACMMLGEYLVRRRKIKNVC